VVAYGFWIFLLSDIVMFSALFAAYAVLRRATAGSPTGAEPFNQVSVALETAFLLASSYTCGLMSLAVNGRRRVGTYLGGVITFALGAAFLALEIRKFATDSPIRPVVTCSPWQPTSVKNAERNALRCAVAPWATMLLIALSPADHGFRFCMFMDVSPPLRFQSSHGGKPPLSYARLPFPTTQ
jgi:hypothetical protein